MINLLAAASLDLNEAWNLAWGEGIQIILVLAFVYWLKVKIDTRAGLGTNDLMPTPQAAAPDAPAVPANPFGG